MNILFENIFLLYTDNYKFYRYDLANLHEKSKKSKTVCGVSGHLTHHPDYAPALNFLKVIIATFMYGCYLHHSMKGDAERNN